MGDKNKEKLKKSTEDILIKINELLPSETKNLPIQSLKSLQSAIFDIAIFEKNFSNLKRAFSENCNAVIALKKKILYLKEMEQLVKENIESAKNLLSLKNILQDTTENLPNKKSIENLISILYSSKRKELKKLDSTAFKMAEEKEIEFKEKLLDNCYENLLKRNYSKTQKSAKLLSLLNLPKTSLSLTIFCLIRKWRYDFEEISKTILSDFTKTGQKLSENEKLVVAFRKALDEAFQFFKENSEEIRQDFGPIAMCFFLKAASEELTQALEEIVVSYKKINGVCDKNGEKVDEKTGENIKNIIKIDQISSEMAIFCQELLYFKQNLTDLISNDDFLLLKSSEISFQNEQKTLIFNKNSQNSTQNEQKNQKNRKNTPKISKINNLKQFSLLKNTKIPSILDVFNLEQYFSNFDENSISIKSISDFRKIALSPKFEKFRFDLIDHFVFFERLYLREGFFKAVENFENGHSKNGLEKLNGDILDDIFYIFKKVFLRSFDVPDCNSVCASFNHLNYFLKDEVIDKVKEIWNNEVFKRKPLEIIQYCEKDCENQFFSNFGYLTAFTENLKVLFKTVTDKIELSKKIFNEKEFLLIEACLGDFQKNLDIVNNAENKGIKLISNLLFSRLIPILDDLTKFDFKSTEKENSNQCQSLAVSKKISQLISPFEKLIEGKNLTSKMILIISEMISNQIENKIFDLKFSIWGGIKLDSEIRGLISSLSVFGGVKVREKFLKLLQIASVLQAENAEDIDFFEDSSSGVWNLNRKEMLNLLQLRIDLN